MVIVPTSTGHDIITASANGITKQVLFCTIAGNKFLQFDPTVAIALENIGSARVSALLIIIIGSSDNGVIPTDVNESPKYIVRFAVTGGVGW